MLEQLDYTKKYASHYIQLGSSYIRNAMLSFDEKRSILLSPFDREYPKTIFLSGTIIISKKESEVLSELSKDLEISLEEMQNKLNEAPHSWSVQLP